MNHRETADKYRQEADRWEGGTPARSDALAAAQLHATLAVHDTAQHCLTALCVVIVILAWTLLAVTL